MNPIQIGLLGVGTVGGGTCTVLKRNREEIARRAGREIVVKMIADTNLERARSLADAGVIVTADGHEVTRNPDIDIVVELIGGQTIAKELILEAIANGKHVVTANKALLANHGTEIFAAARAKGVIVAFEAAVAGGIPIIKALREGLTANRITWIAGIINGTSNFILSEMRDKGLSFDQVLMQAQKLGYAEADPTYDIEGIDAAHKITLMSAIAFGIPVQFSKVYVEGITKLTGDDIRYAEELGYRIKLLGITKRVEKGIELRVHPTLIPMKRLIANVEGVMNAIVVKGDAVGASDRLGHLALQRAEDHSGPRARHALRRTQGRDRRGPRALQEPGELGDLHPHELLRSRDRRHRHQAQGAREVEDLVTRSVVEATEADRGARFDRSWGRSRRRASSSWCSYSASSSGVSKRAP